MGFHEIDARIGWAEICISRMRDCLLAYRAAEPFEVRIRDDMGARQRVYYVAAVKPFPDELVFLCKDAIHNLRAPLDEAAFSLECAANGGEVPAHFRDISFPIADSVEKYQHLRANRLRGASQAAVEVIDRCEPFRTGKGHLLWQLHHLDIADKHRILKVALHAGAVSVRPEMVEFIREVTAQRGATEAGEEMIRGLPELAIRAEPEPVEIGTELYREPLEKVALSRRFGLGVALHLPDVISYTPAVVGLRRIAVAVRGVVDALRPHLS